jgi:hypothetical protein
MEHNTQAQIIFLKRLKGDATTNRNGGTIVFAADAEMLESIIKNLEEKPKEQTEQ